MVRKKSSKRKCKASPKKAQKKVSASSSKKGKRTAKKKTIQKKAKRAPVKRARRKSRRDGARYPGLEGRFFSRIKQEYHDIDYADKLNHEEKVWMSSFYEEDLGANFGHPGQKIYKNSNPKRKASYRRNNYRNLDLYGQAKVQGKVVDTAVGEGLDEQFENDLIESINKRQEAAIEETKFLTMVTKLPSGKDRK